MNKLAALFLSLILTDAAFGQVSTAFTYQGQLQDGGQPASGAHDFEFQVYDAANAGNPIGAVILSDDVLVVDGLFQVELDVVDGAFLSDDRWLEVRVRPGESTAGFTTLLPRQRVTPVPLARHALSVAAGSVDGSIILDGSISAADIDSSEIQRRIVGSCPSGQSIRSVAANGTVTCEPDNDSGGDITGVSAGAGLDGGGTAGSVSLSVAIGGIDSAMVADGTLTVADLDTNASGLYGDEELGDVTLTGTGSFPAPFPMFRNLTVESGATLFVNSGTVLRCTGTFTNAGTVIVTRAANAGTGSTGDNPVTHQPAHPGLSRLGAGILDQTTGGGSAATGARGGLGNPEWDRLVSPGLYAGGGGSGQLAGAGGGSMVVLCKDGVINSGQILADGESHPFIGGSVNGGGGGGGGFILLASASSIDNSGTVSARGGQGGPSDSSTAAGGGGGGGMVHFLAPSVSNTGSVLVSGGAAGVTGQTPVDDFVIYGGGGGGGAAGNGGNGGSVSANVAQSASDGLMGQFTTTSKDPGLVFAAY